MRSKEQTALFSVVDKLTVPRHPPRTVQRGVQACMSSPLWASSRLPRKPTLRCVQHWVVLQMKGSCHRCLDGIRCGYADSIHTKLYTKVDV